MVEPMWYRPWDVSRLTDFQIMSIITRQSDNVKAMRSGNEKPLPSPVAPPPTTENVRCGAAYEYLISTGMSPEQAERVIRSR